MNWSEVQRKEARKSQSGRIDPGGLSRPRRLQYFHQNDEGGYDQKEILCGVASAVEILSRFVTSGRGTLADRVFEVQEI